MLQPSIIKELDRRGAARQPFFFLIDYRGNHCLIDDGSGPAPFYASISGQESRPLGSFPHDADAPEPSLTAEPEDYDSYRRRFETIRNGQQRGDSYLANLTLRTPVRFTGDPVALLGRLQAKYRVWLPGRFLCFSPEIFVRVTEDGRIHSHPMKGTIDATLPDAAERILADPKERAESATIVDLIRNDLSSVATQVRVTRYRYIDRITTATGALLQVSSEVEGKLPDRWQDHLGQILDRLLPAGSITGAPKEATIALIDRAEQHDRGFYTGTCGYYDGKTLDSGVLIRFIERDGNRYYYHAGGGITINSDCRSEYDEVIEKIYLPL
jgi:para-aminobenzoate synthetase component 1